MPGSHTVPKLYLKRFLNSKVHRTTWEYLTIVSDSNVDVWEDRNIKKLTVVEGIYLGYLERLFSRSIENQASLVFDKIAGNNRLSPADYIILSDYILLQKLRTTKYLYNFLKNPDIYTKVETDLGKLMEKLEKDIKQGRHRKNPEKLRRFPSNRHRRKKIKEKRIATRVHRGVPPFSLCIREIDGKIRVEASTCVLQVWNYFITFTFLYRKIKEKFRKQQWHILESKGSFFTSDDPVLVIDKAGNIVDNLYFLDSGHTFIFPVDPDHLVVMVYDENYNYEAKHFRSKIDWIRQCIAKNAFKRIFSSKKDDEIPEYRPRTVDKDKYDAYTKNMDTIASIPLTEETFYNYIN